MIDPLSLSYIAGGLAKSFGEVAPYIAKITKLDKAIETLQKEIHAFSTVLDALQQHIPQVGSYAIASRTDQKLWENITISLDGSKNTLHRLNKMVDEIHKTKGNIFRKGLQQFKMDRKAGDIELLQREIAACRQVVDVSLQIII